MALGGLDIGTSGCKCTIMTVGGKLLSTSYLEYAASRTSGAHQIDPDTIWSAVKAVIADAVKRSGEEMTALCVTSFGESCVLLDEKDQPLAPILLYTDPRGQEQCDALIDRLGEREIYRICGHRPNPMYFLPKLMWYRDNQPALYAKIRQVLPVHGYIVHQLSGENVTDLSMAARMMMLDVRGREWSKPLLEAAGIPAELLPRLAETGEAVGTVQREIAAELGLKPDLKVVIGCHDQVAASIGAGAMRPGTAVNGSGTVECITPVFETIPEHPALFDGGFAMVPACGYYVTYAFIFTGGALLQWYRDQFGAEAKALAKETGKGVYAVLDSGVGPDPSGLLVLPHFAGAATPYMNPLAKGAICGLSVENTAAEVYRGMLEGIAYETRVNMERLEEAGIRIDSLRTTGGGGRSKTWVQIKADIFKKPIDTLTVDEAGTVGSIMLAGAAVGEYASLEEAMKLTKTKTRYLPAADCARYDGIYGHYKRLYTALQAVYQ